MEQTILLYRRNMSVTTNHTHCTRQTNENWKDTELCRLRAWRQFSKVAGIMMTINLSLSPSPDQQTKESSKIMEIRESKCLKHMSCLSPLNYFLEIVYLIIWVVASKQANKTLRRQTQGFLAKLAVILWAKSFIQILQCLFFNHLLLYNISC